MTLSEVQAEYPYIDWLSYINAILHKDVQIKDHDVINVSVKRFFKDLEKILKETPKRTMANYVMWLITKSSSFYLTEKLRKRQLQYSKDVSGIEALEPRWKECVSATIDDLPMSVSALYIRKYFRNDAKKAALEMVQNIRVVFENILQTVDWMDATTREQGQGYGFSHWVPG
jgi:neprilysin